MNAITWAAALESRRTGLPLHPSFGSDQRPRSRPGGT